jgi:hypothetical protein
VVEKGGGAHAFSVVLAEGKKAWPWEEEEHASLQGFWYIATKFITTTIFHCN